VKEVVIGTCKLCETERVRLLESHLMPAGFFRRLLSEEKNPHPLLLSEKGVRTSSEQVTDNVLCEKCETRFHENGEDYTLRKAADKDGFPLLEELLINASGGEKDFRKSTITDSPGIKRDQLVYFALSVFWRAAIHRWPDRSRKGRTVKIELGDDNTETLRRILLGGISVPSTVNVLLFVLTDRLSQATVNLPSQTSRINFRWGYGFVATGYMFNLFVGKSPDPRASRTCLIHSPEQFIWIRDGEVKTLETIGKINRRRVQNTWPR
jgi:hypothetical protein